MRTDPTAAYRTAPLDELLTVLLRQFKRPLAGRGVPLTDSEAASVARYALDPAPDHPIQLKAEQIREALIALIEESERVLADRGLTFAESLVTDMAHLSGWTTTAEFIEIANIKGNAELRISTGSALVTALGDPRFVAHLHTVIRRAEPDLDTVIAQRVLELHNA